MDGMLLTAGLAIGLHGVNHAYGKGAARRQVLFDLSLEIRRGEVVFLMGPSGCGKTTVLTLVGALRSVQQGRVDVLGHALAGADEAALVRARRRVGFIFQGDNLHRSLSAVQNVRMGLEARGEAGRPDTMARCLAMLDAVGLSDHAGKRQNELSGGQKQRVAIARALVATPELVLADEPTAALDSRTGRECVSLLRDLAHQRGATVLMVTHDNRILDLADRMLTMEDGRLIDGPMS
jgi:putative ABC transport system ATP-binding protein